MSVNYTVDQITEHMQIIMQICHDNNELYKNNKPEMMVKLREWDPVFYNRHYRVCKSIVFEDNITELFDMLARLKEIEKGNTTLKTQDKHISDTYNGKYINPALNTKEMIEERKQKMINDSHNL